MVEMVVVVAVIFVLLGVGLPFFTQAYRDYQLNDAATQVAGILKAARFEAIRRNVPVPLNCIIQQTGNGPTNISVQGTQTQILLSSTMRLVAGGAVPNTGALAAAVGVAVLTPVNPAAATIPFDFRGAVNPAGVYAIYINDVAPGGGFRAVILLPSGSVQVWATSPGGVGGWRQLS